MTEATDTSIRIREAADDDIATLVRVRRLMFESMEYQDRNRLDEADAAFDEYLRREMPAGDVMGWIAEDPETGAVAGGLTCIWVQWPSSPYIAGEGRAYLFGLYVYPEYRRKGIARSLVETARDEAGRRGTGAVMLHASDMGRPLYETMGFEPTSEMRLILRKVGERRG